MLDFARPVQEDTAMKALLLLGLLFGLLLAPAPARGQAATALGSPGSLADAAHHRARAETPAPAAPIPVVDGSSRTR